MDCNKNSHHNTNTMLQQILIPVLPLQLPSQFTHCSFPSVFPSIPPVRPQISEKQKSLYEALERQQHYQESLQSISTKMESIEGALNEGLEPNKSPESQMAAHQVRERGDRGQVK